MSSDAPRFSFPVGGNDLAIEGWDAIEGLAAAAQADKSQEEQMDQAMMYSQCFASDAGRYVLKELMAAYLRQRIVQPDQDPKNDAIRQGNADVVHRILFLIEFANTGAGQTK